MVMLVGGIVLAGLNVFISSALDSARIPMVWDDTVFPEFPDSGVVLSEGMGLTYNESGSWNCYPRGPNLDSARRAGLLFGDVFELMDSADLVVVLGGSHGKAIPMVADGMSGSNPSLISYAKPFVFLGAMRLDVPQLSREVSNSLQVRGVLPETYFVEAPSEFNFTVLYLRAGGFVLGATECFRMVGSDNKVYYVVNHYRQPKDVNGAYVFSGVGLHSYYRFYLDVSEDVWEIPVGAKHHWYRYDPVFYRYEEAPAQVVYPDPYMVGDNKNAMKSISRFTFFIDPMN